MHIIMYIKPDYFFMNASPNGMFNINAVIVVIRFLLNNL